MLNNNRGNALLIIPIILVIVSLTGAGAFYLYNNSKPAPIPSPTASPLTNLQENIQNTEPLPTPTTDPSPTTSPASTSAVIKNEFEKWNKFTSESGKFSFLYPDTWMYKAVPEVYPSQSLAIPILFNNKSLIDRDNYLFEVAYSDIPIEKFPASFNFEIGNNKITSLVEEITIQGKKAYKTNVESVELEDPTQNLHFNKAKNFDIYIIEIDKTTTLEIDIRKDQADLGQKILSTLVFNP